MLEKASIQFLSELNYCGSLHIKHVRLSPTLKWEVLQFLVAINKIQVDTNGFIWPV